MAGITARARQCDELTFAIACCAMLGPYCWLMSTKVFIWSLFMIYRSQQYFVTRTLVLPHL